MLTITDLQRYFDRPRPHRSGGKAGFVCNCPACGDTRGRLFVFQRDGEPEKIYFKCQNDDCTRADILSAVRLSEDDLRPPRPEYDALSRLEFGWKKQHGDGCHVVRPVYDYKDESGRVLYTKIRFEGGDIKGKAIRYYTFNQAANDGAGKYESSKAEDRPHVLYRLPELLHTLEEGRTRVCIVEGEKDVETIRNRLHWTATTAGGASDWKKSFAPTFRGARVYVFPDNDEPGRKLSEAIKNDLRDYAYSVTIIPTAAEAKGDITDYFSKEGGTEEDLRARIKAAEAPEAVGKSLFYASWIQAEPREVRGEIVCNPKINPDLLADAISRNEKYLIVRRPGDENESIYTYRGGVYQQTNKNGLREIIRKYIPIGHATATTIDNVLKLILASGRKQTNPALFNADPRFINLQNGLLDVRSGILKAHTPDVLSTMQINVRYDPGARYPQDCPTFKRYLDDFVKDPDGNQDETKRAVLQEYFGLALSNVPGWNVKQALILYSELGNTGKSRLLDLLTYMLGQQYATNLQIKDMGNPFDRFALSSVGKARVIICGDQSGAEVQDSSNFKRLTGGDPVSVELKGQNKFDMIYNGVCMFACNTLPYFSDDKGGHLFERLLIVPCEHTVPEGQRDPGLLDKMKKETPAIFNFFLEGLRRLLRNNYQFTRSESAEGSLREYRQKSDTVFYFLSSNYELTGDRRDTVKKTDLENEYTQFCEKEDLRAVKGRNIKDRMNANGVTFNPRGDIRDGSGRRLQSGVYCYCGLKKKAPQLDKGQETFQQMTVDDLKTAEALFPGA